ncbi:MAG: hypothetical protein ACRDQ4_20250 [Pseudonocardiaceae bacterium]
MPDAEQGLYFYSETGFEGEERFYPVEKIIPCEVLPFPAKSYKNISQLAVVGYTIRGMKESSPELVEYPINGDGDLDPPIIFFGTGSWEVSE